MPRHYAGGPGLGRRLVLLLLLVLGAGSRVEGGDEGFDAALTKEQTALLGRLESHATWCGDNKLALERDAIFRLMLRLKPDHARARGGLKYTRAGKGKPWVQKDYKAPRNWEVGKLPEAKQRLARVVDGYAERVMALVGQATEAVPEARRQEAFEHAIDVAPAYAPLRKELGHVEHAGAWRLPETVEALAQRKRFAELRTQVKRGTPPPRIDPAGVRADWSGARKLGELSVWSTDEGEADAVLGAMAAGDGFCRHVVGPADAHAVVFRLLCVADRKDAIAWLDAQDARYEQARRDVHNFGTVGLPGGSFLTYVGSTADRAAIATRYVIGRWVHRLATGSRDRGWVSEGIGQRLAWHARLTHGAKFSATDRTGTADGSEEDPEAAIELPPIEEPWLAAAAEVLDRQALPRFESLLTRRLNAMEPEDVLAAYALAAYLIEGRPDALRPLVQASLEKDGADEQVREALGIELGTLAWRVRRFTLESAELEAAAIATR